MTCFIACIGSYWDGVWAVKGGWDDQSVLDRLCGGYGGLDRLQPMELVEPFVKRWKGAVLRQDLDRVLPQAHALALRSTDQDLVDVLGNITKVKVDGHRAYGNGL